LWRAGRPRPVDSDSALIQTKIVILFQFVILSEAKDLLFVSYA
jgi:hypothetical protein